MTLFDMTQIEATQQNLKGGKHLANKFGKSFHNPQVIRGIIAGGVIALAITAVSIIFWGGKALTFETIFTNTTIGLALGSLYAVYATGLVVLYNTTGVFNFAQGAIGVFGAFIYWELHFNDNPLVFRFIDLFSITILPEKFHLHSLIAMPIALLVCGAIGIILDVLIMRKLKETSLLVQMLITVAIMVLILALAGDIWNADQPRPFSPLFGGSGPKIFGATITLHRILVFVTAGAVAIGLRLFLKKTRLGIAMRSVVDSRELASLTGTNPNVISSSAWALGSMLAGLGGILIAPEFQTLDPTNLNTIVIIAFAAAACGALRNLPMAFIGAIAIGLIKQHTSIWLDLSTDYRNIPDAFAPFILLVVMVVIPDTRLELTRIVKGLRSRERVTLPWEAIIGGAMLILVAVALSGGWLNFGFWNPSDWGLAALNNSVAAMALILIATSLIPLTGWTGQINLAPLAFAGFGAFIYTKFIGDAAFGQWYWLPLVAIATAPLGALVAITAARLKGVYLGLASLAFAQLMTFLFFAHSEITPNFVENRQFERLEIIWFNFKKGFHRLKLINDLDEFRFLVVVFAIVIVVLVFLRHSRFGRRWVALSDSEVASASIGVNIVWTKVAVYSFSAAIAGLAGVFWGVANTSFTADSYDILEGLALVLLLAAAGASIPVAGIFLSFRFLISGLAKRLADTDSVDWLMFVFEKLEKYGPGLLALGMVVNSRGAVFRIGQGFAQMLPWRRDAKIARKAEIAKAQDPEFGELGLEKEFLPDKVMDLDRRLGILSYSVPEGGYEILKDNGLGKNANGTQSKPEPVETNTNSEQKTDK